MWIKLISPEFSRRPMDSAWKTQMSPPLGLLTVGALTPPEHRVTLADENVERVQHGDKPDVAAFSVTADTFPRASALARLYRARGVKVVMGGIHPTACPEECLGEADAVVVGEAEGSWARLLQDHATGRLGRIYRPQGPVDMAAVPIPRWDLLRANRYLFTNTLTIGRGCPWRCEFCYNSSPNIQARYRTKELGQIRNEIQSLNGRHVMFIDDNFIGDPGFARRLTAMLGRMGLTWHAAVSADVGRHDGLLESMAEAGCRSLFIGFETLNPKNLMLCRKNQNRVDVYDTTIARIHSLGMMVNASVVFGFDHDEPGVFDETVTWLERNKVSTMTGHILTPYPGTELHRKLQAGGRIISRDLRLYNTAHAVFRPARMSPDELEHGYRRAYNRFYSWRSIGARLPVAHNQRIAFLMFNLCYRKFGKLTSVAGRAIGMRPLAKLAKALSYAEKRADPQPFLDRSPALDRIPGMHVP
jgi:radical SAM superfamily enzyme YgiQ (UPF0313 family)